MSFHNNKQRELLPTRTVDQVLLTGGQLSRFQSVAVLMIGIAVALLIGVPMLLIERAIAAAAAATGEHFRNVSLIVLGYTMITFGLLIAANGAVSLWRSSKHRLQARTDDNER